MDSQHLDSDKVRRIRELEDNVRIQEEVVINLKEKLSNNPQCSDNNNLGESNMIKEKVNNNL